MMTNHFFPLRTIVGPSIPIAKVSYLDPESHFKFYQKKSNGVEEVVHNRRYSSYLPIIKHNSVEYSHAKGMNTMPIPDTNLFHYDNIIKPPFSNILDYPSDNPFPNSDPIISIFGKSERMLGVEFDKLSGRINSPRTLLSQTNKSKSFLIYLEKEVLVGGICFKGFPYLSSKIENLSEGIVIGNFGLPREIRLTPLPPTIINNNQATDEVRPLSGFHQSQFIDSEFAYLRQEMSSHSGFNFLTIDPVKTNLFLLTLSDLPYLPKLIDFDSIDKNGNNVPVMLCFEGFAIPYLYFFEYKEHTKQYARLPCGLLGLKTES